MTLPAPSVQADYFDGRSSRRQSDSLRLEGGRLHLAGEQIERLAPLAELRLSEPMGSAPRLITFPDGAYCEVRDVAGLSCLLQASGQHDSWIVRWQFDLRAVALAAVLCMLCGVAGYLYGLPWISARLAEQIPTAAVNSISTRLLAELDKEFLAPSRLSEARQAEISRRFAALQTAEEHTPAYEIVFRANRRLPANAFALLGLRALYFLLKGLLDKLVYLSVGLALFLVFIGVKLVLLWAHETWPAVPKIETSTSLIVIAAVLTVTALASWWAVRRDPDRIAHAGTVTDPRRDDDEPKA